ncbi:D-mannonate oxidoreductase, partial [Bacillus licheniformis]
MQIPFHVNLKDKVAVVTGGSGILCSGFAKALAQCGAKVAVVSRRAESADRVARDIQENGGEALA